MAEGRAPADMCLHNVHVVDVYSHRVHAHMSVRVGDGVILGFGDGPSTERMDAQGQYMLPGLMDAHVHIESAMLTPVQFARMVLPLGTTCVVADPHEIANVLGMTGIEYMLQATEHLPLHVRIMLPSCVPATPFDHAGAVLRAADLAPLMGHERVAGLGEMMNYPGVIMADNDVLDKIYLAHAHHKIIDGHSPSLCGHALDTYIAAGIRTDHECTTPKEMCDRLARGMYVLIRQGSAAQDLAQLIGEVTPFNVHRCLLCTDDRHADDILQHGHINHSLRLAVQHGLDPLLAVRMATLNTALCYNMPHKGGIAPGMDADLILVNNLQDFAVSHVFVQGRKVAEHGRMCLELDATIPPSLTQTVRPAPINLDTFSLPLPSGKARVMGLIPRSIATQALERTIHTHDGHFDPALNPDLVLLAVIERHKGTGHVGLGLMHGYVAEGKRLGGAIATTIAHDSHNIVLAGDNAHDMCVAVHDLVRMGGGITLVRQGGVVAHLPLPVAGLMSNQPAEYVQTRMALLMQHARLDFGIHPDIDPFMTLSFMALAVIPDLKLTDQGLFDVRSFRFVSVDMGDT